MESRGYDVADLKAEVSTLGDKIDKLSDDYQRTDFLPSIQNKIKIAIDTQTGPNGDKVEHPKYAVNPKDFPNDTTYQKALAYVTQLNFAKDQLAFVYSGGYSPESGFYNMAQDTIGKYLGNVGERTVSKQVRIEMAIRKKSQDDALQGKVTDSGDDGSGGQGDMQQMIDKAKSAGYSDEEIQQYLKSKGMK